MRAIKNDLAEISEVVLDSLNSEDAESEARYVKDLLTYSS